MTEIVPLSFRWDGENMVPLKRFVPRANQQYVVGEEYRLKAEHERSEPEHRFFFASFHEAWTQLPTDTTERFKNEDQFRYWCLINCGYVKSHTQTIVRSESELVRAIQKAMLDDPYSIIKKRGNTLDIWAPKSQSRNSMSKDEFHKSASDVLVFVCEMLGITVDELTANAGRAA